MARFNPDDYETVEERLKRAHEMYEDLRVITEDVFTDIPETFIVRASIYLSAGDQANKLPKATGLASEKQTGPQAAWALELAETSAIGRALANMNLSGNKRASREEMQKVLRAEDAVEQTLSAKRDWLADAKASDDVEYLRKLYVEAKAAGQPSYVLKEIEKLAKVK